MCTKNDETVALVRRRVISGGGEGERERSGRGVITRCVYWGVMGVGAMVKSIFMTIDLCRHLDWHNYMHNYLRIQQSFTSRSMTLVSNYYYEFTKKQNKQLKSIQVTYTYKYCINKIPIYYAIMQPSKDS